MTDKARPVELTTPTWIGVACLAVTAVAARNLSVAGAVVVAVAMTIVVSATAAAQHVRDLLAKTRRTPMRSQGLDLGAFQMPPRAPRKLMQPAGLEWLPVGLAALGVAGSIAAGNDVLALIGVIAGAGLAATPVVVLARLQIADERSGLAERATVAVSEAVARLDPELVIYFSGIVEELYQLRMWFAPVQRLGLRTLVIVRGEHILDHLKQPPFPVVCARRNDLVASLPLPKRVVTLFPTHSGDNLSMVRRPETVCVFVGHGESDKPDSSNPYARLYDEVWVAGPLGRRRYAEAAVGVRDERIREVGRPQFVAPTEPPPQPPVIVYAPTWEGWGDDAHHSSLAHAGIALVEALLATPGVKVRYRPHPLTGIDNPVVRRAHEEIIKRVGCVPPSESIGATFAGASCVVTDVSSVIAEYLPLDRPYALIDTRGLGRRAMSRRWPSTAGAFLLGADLSGLDALIAAAKGGRDATAARRRALIADSLGDPATSQQRFAAEVDRLRRG